MCIISRGKEVLAGNFSQEKYVHDVTSFHLATLATSFLFVFIMFIVLSSRNLNTWLSALWFGKAENN